MKTLGYWLIQIVFFALYTYIALLVTDNFWLAVILGLLLVYAFGNALKIRKLHELFSGGLVGAFEENDEHHNRHTQEIESLKEQVESLEEQVKSLEDKIEELQHPYTKEIL